MLLINLKNISFILVLLVSACSQNDSPFDTDQGKQSATAVKSQTQTLYLKPLSTDALRISKSESTKTDSALNDPTRNPHIKPSLRGVNDLFNAKISNVQVQDTGKVIKILPDDNHGSRHQKFLVKMVTGQTLLFAHNIDLAQRIADIQIGDTVTFRGEYVYNPKGGIVHWTHRDPQGKHFGGWIKHNGNIYQ